MIPRLTKYILHTPHPKQQAFLLLDCLDAFYGGAGGGGKALSADSLVCTPFGFRKISELKIGERVCTTDGSNSKIIGIFPQGMQQLYEITFSDGAKVKATDEHIWKYSISEIGKWKKSGLSYKLALTEQLKILVDNGKHVSIPLSKPVQFTRSYKYNYRQIAPYVLGCLLGDGSITHSPVKIHSDDIEIIEKMSKVSGYTWHKYGGYITYRVLGEESKELSYWLKKNKLYGVNTYKKFIPEQYKYADINSRLELLRGLMDTDGSCSVDGKAYYSSVSKQLSLDVQWIVRSLGGNATITESQGVYTKNGIKKEVCMSYDVYIRMPDNADIFSLSRKKELAIKYNAGNCELKKRILSIIPVERNEAICIKIDRPDGLFITNDFIVTHNSDALLMAALQYVDIPGYNAILIRDTYANLVKPEGLLYRAHEWLAGTDAHWDGDSRSYVFPSGATLSFGYLDGPRDHLNYQGPAYTFVGIDEMVNIKQHQAEYMFSRLRKKDKKAYLIDLKKLPQYKDLPEEILLALQKAYAKIPIRFRGTANPPSRQQLATGKWVKDKYVDKKSRDKSTIFIPAGIKDNPSLNETEYRKSLDRLDPITRKQIMDGDWNINVSGRIISRAWFKIVDIFPEDQIVKKVRFWDLAATEENVEENNDPCYTAGVKMGLTKDNQYIIINITRFRKKPLGVEQMIRQVADIDTTKVPIHMEHEGGSGGKNTIDHYRRNILREFVFGGDLPKGSKIERASPFASQAEAGNVLLLNGAWVEDFLDEADVFPDGKFKDQIDACSGAFTALATRLNGIRVRYV